jgi:hypothetical protein
MLAIGWILTTAGTSAMVKILVEVWTLATARTRACAMARVLIGV